MLAYNLQPAAALKANGVTKGKCFEGLDDSNHEYDCALPAQWLEEMQYKYQGELPPNLIQSTCVIVYLHDYDEVEVATCCQEVYDVMFCESPIYDRAKWRVQNQTIFDLYEELSTAPEIYKIRVLQACKAISKNPNYRNLVDELASHFYVDIDSPLNWVAE